MIKKAAAPKTCSAISGEDRVKDIIKRYPSTQKVFAKYEMDMCCGGEHPISMAAKATGADEQAILTELNRAAAISEAPDASGW